MTKIFGANWASTVWGFLFAIAIAIANTPSIIAPLPDAVEPYIIMICILITGSGFAASVKSRNVTGGTVQQTVSGAKADEGTQNLVDHTVIASIESGDDSVTTEQRRAVNK